MRPGRLSLVTVLLLAVLGSTQAQVDFQPKFTFGSGVLLGSAYEFVFSPTQERFYNDPVSRLQWPVAPSATLQMMADLPWTDWTATRVELRVAWPLGVATLVDEDWKAATYSGFLIYGRSEHSLFLVSHVSARAEQDFRWAPFSLSAGVYYRETHWNGWNGTGHYEYGNGTVSNPTYSGLVLAYRQQWLIPHLGARWTWNLGDWTLEPSLRLGPYSWCFDVDRHNYPSSTTTTFLDYTRGGIYGQGAVESVFPGGPHWSWGLRLEGEIQWGSVGDTIETHSSNTVTTFPSSANSAGAGFQEASFSVFVRN